GRTLSPSAARRAAADTAADGLRTRPTSPREQILHLVHEPARLRRRLPFRRRVALQQLALLVVERRRDLHHDVNVVVAAAGALQELHALAAQAEDLIGLRSRRDAQRFGAVDGLGLDL